MLHTVGFDDHGHAGPYPRAQRIGRVEVERAEEIAHAVRHGVVIGRGPDLGGCAHPFYDTAPATCPRSVHSSSVRAAYRERSQAASARTATAKTSQQPFNVSNAPTRRSSAPFK